MVRSRVTFIFIIVIIFNFSCTNYIPLRVKKNFNRCYDSSLNVINSKIKFNGYYVKVTPFERSHYDIKSGKQIGITKDTLYTNLMFFSDGLVIKGFHGLNCGNCDIYRNSQYLFEVSQNKNNEEEIFYKAFNWGLYSIEGDTIKLNILNHQPYFNPYWYLFEQWYLINKDGSISPLYNKNLIYNESIPIDSISYSFIKTDVNIKPEPWLKNKKWFWCDKAAYKKWKKEQRKNKQH